MPVLWCALCVSVWLAGRPPVQASGPASALHRYWPRFPRPNVVLTVPEVRSQDEAFLLQSAAGLAARAALRGRNRTMVWYPMGHPAYVAWKAAMLRQTQAREEILPDVWAVVERLRRIGLVSGYVLFRRDATDRRLHERGGYDPSANVATVLAAQLQGVLVTEELEQAARERGLPRQADARGVSEEECFARWGHGCSRRVLAMLDPKLAHCRAEAIALDAFVLATYGPLLDRALARLEPDSPILGWGMGDERKLTEPVSRWAAFQTATNWCLNLPLLATEQVGVTIPRGTVRARATRLWDLSWEDGAHYTAFLMTDGDNVQWLMGDFQFGAERSWWNSPARGRFPIGWGACIADLLQLCPYAWQNLVRTATPKDDLVLMGGGYYYPDLFGASRDGTAALRRHARRIRSYLLATGTRVLHMNATVWDSPDAIRAYRVFAEEIPELEGILMVQYAPYTAGEGKTLWVRRRDGTEMPVVSARFAIWGQSPFPQDGPPSEVARRLNAEPRFSPEVAFDARRAGRPSPVPGFSWVSVHCWSWFQPAPEGSAETAEEVDQARPPRDAARRGLEPVEWCVRRLAPHVRVVTPTELVLLMNLRMRPRQTLSRALAALKQDVRKLPQPRRSVAMREIADSMSYLGRGMYREAFMAGRRAARLASTRR